MPIYDYRCRACGHQFEQHQKFSDPLVKVCPECGQEAVEKQLHPPSIVFKGTGFYKNDSRPASKESKPTAKKDD